MALHYYYEFKHNMHCICAMRLLPLEYLGVKDTCDSKDQALRIIKFINS
jgi:hypothetical protein